MPETGYCKAKRTGLIYAISIAPGLIQGAGADDSNPRHATRPEAAPAEAVAYPPARRRVPDREPYESQA